MSACYRVPVHTVRNFWWISLYLTDDANSKALCDVKFRPIEGNGGKFRHI